MTQEILPFLISKAIILGADDQIRFGKELLNFHDSNHCQVYQAIFMEMVGFKVDQVFIMSWLKKHTIKDPSLDMEVVEFLENRADFLKARAVVQYKASRNPLEKLEYKMNLLIGPKMIKKRIEQA